MHICDIDPARAGDLAGRLRQAFPACLATAGAESPEIPDIVVNATPVGLHAGDPLPVAAELLRPGMLVVDIIMEPAETALLAEARRRGCRVQPGRPMMDHQIRAIAARFAAAGHAVVIAGRDAARGAAAVAECLAQGAGAARFEQMDVGDPASVAALAAAAGRPDVLVNSAGILQSGQPVLTQDLDEDERLWRINYRGTLVACQQFGARMAGAGRGAILNIGSLASFAPLSLPAYTPGKQALRGLTEMLAAELGPRGVRVNAVAPGYTLSDGLKAKIAAGERDAGAIIATAALRRFVEPRDVAEAAFFLCSDRAASITGVTLPVDARWLVQAPYAQYLRGNPIRGL